MKVTPLKKKFGKYAIGDEFEFPDKAAKVFIKAGKLQQVQTSDLSYQTRMMQAAPSIGNSVAGYFMPDQNKVSAPYGLKADGTPRRRPGRPAATE